MFMAVWRCITVIFHPMNFIAFVINQAQEYCRFTWLNRGSAVFTIYDNNLTFNHTI